MFWAKFLRKERLDLVEYEVDVKESMIKKKWPGVLELLLLDHTTNKNIFWATDLYEKRYKSRFYAFRSPITIDLITEGEDRVIKPRVTKEKQDRQYRIKDKAEVFTPAWICNKQNNLIDNDWFGYDGVFNNEKDDNTWTATKKPVVFPENKTWVDYVRELRLEVACGEAPYLVSRYDITTGKKIKLQNRIGLLDRKIRIVNENAASDSEWLAMVKWAFKSTYGYEWQGDNLLLARENLLFTFIDYFEDRFGKEPDLDLLKEIAEIISWNIWQMDGIRGVLPCTCCNSKYIDLFGEKTMDCCLGCKTGDIHSHNGKYCYIGDWNKMTSKGQPKRIKYISLLKGKK